MPPRTATAPAPTPPLHGYSRSLAALSIVLMLLLAACAGDSSGAPTESASAAPATASPELSMDPAASIDPRVVLCSYVDTLAEHVAGLQAVELRVTNQVSLDIALGQIQADYNELRQAGLGEMEERLQDPLRRLGYRIDELSLAVEDFSTNSRPRQAAPHVEGDAAMVADTVASFGILARC